MEKKYNIFLLISFIISISIFSLILIFDSESYFEFLKPSFALQTTDSPTSFSNNISEMIKKGDYNFDIIRDFYKAIEFYEKGT